MVIRSFCVWKSEGCCLLICAHAEVVPPHVSSQIRRAVVSNCSSSENKLLADMSLTPDLGLTSLFITIIKKSSLTFVFTAHSHTNQRPKHPYITLSLFHLRPDADDKLILRTNSIITNNPHSWQPHKKSLDE